MTKISDNILIRLTTITKTTDEISMQITLSPLLKLGPLLAAGLFISVLSGCSSTSTSPPKNPENLCEIFKEKPDWYASAKTMEKNWKVPVQVPMAMMYQESSFKHDARPPKKYILGFIPNGRISSAVGYSQALDGTWNQYKKSRGRAFADREDFDDAIDFMGWYINNTTRANGVAKGDAYDQYLNYHEGQTGWKRKTYNKKPWLKTVARKVDSRSKRYAGQYQACNLKTKSWWPF